jgi:peptide/nickel transport system substrate-binding protein
MRSQNAGALGALAVLLLAGCGGGGSPGPPASAQTEGTVSMAMTDVGSLDPARASSAQDTELDWALYTGLVTYRHAGGEAGTGLIPGAATTLPQVSDGGRLYTVTLRSGLRFSDGQPLRATDVVATIERAIRTNDSPVRPLLLPVLDGAAAFAAHRARSITGVAADDVSGRVTIRLRRRDPGFDAVLAEPALGIVPAGTRLHDRPGHPPPGIGPYRLRGVRPGRSLTLARNPYWAGLPGIPAGQVNIDVTISPNASANALAVLNNVLDVADPSQPLPVRTLEEIGHQGVGRTAELLDGRPVAYLFLDTRAAPFDDRLAREGVVEGLGAQTLARAGERTLSAECDVVPSVVGGWAPDGCPAPALVRGELASARSLVERSGTAGEPVTVWSPRSGPGRDWLREEAAVLRAIGYASRIVTIPDATYRSELATLVPRPVAPRDTHAGSSRSSSVSPVIARHTAESPGAAVRPVSADAVADGRIAAKKVDVSVAGAITVAVGPDVALRHARQADQVVFGEETVPELMSWRMDESGAIIDPVEGLDFTSLRLR